MYVLKYGCIAVWLLEYGGVAVWVPEYGGVAVWVPEAGAGEIHQIGAGTAQCTLCHSTKHAFHSLLDRTYTTWNTSNLKQRISGSNDQYVAAILSSMYFNVLINSEQAPQHKQCFKMQCTVLIPQK